MKRALILVALALAGQGAQAADWSSWWRTPDQQGDALLKAGKPQDAARTYADPQRKAYAELQGGDYAAAARDYAASNSAEAHYNRGNALAHSGDLAGALKAYDAALAQAPQHRDALHNRDLVQKALKDKQQPPKQNQNKQDQKTQDQKQNQKPGQKDEQKPGDPKDQQKPGEQKDQQKPGQEKDQPKDQPKPGQQPAPDQPKEGKPPADDKKQAAQDAAASLGKDAAGKPPGAKPGLQEPVDPRAEEKRVSEAQWLRAIPDDPGGLLRRKLMIEHMIRQQEGQR